YARGLLGELLGRAAAEGEESVPPAGAHRRDHGGGRSAGSRRQRAPAVGLVESVVSDAAVRPRLGAVSCPARHRRSRRDSDGGRGVWRASIGGSLQQALSTRSEKLA